MADWTATAAGVEGSSPEAPAILPARYRDEGAVGLGGMGQVRRVHDASLDRTLVMKIMRTELAAKPIARARFQREARITAGLQHPGVVAVYDQGELADGRLWYTMREVRGPTLGGLEAPLWTQVEALARVAQALAYAHQQGVVHRDLKPSNIMVGAFGEVLVLDWGLARRVGEVAESDPASPVTGPGLTQAGAVLGTPAYRAPEQTAGQRVGPAADVYALGAMLRDVLASEAEAPAELIALSQRALAHAPADRFPDAAPFAEALGAWLAGSLRRAEARLVLDEAEALLRTLAARRQEADALASQAEAALAPLPPHAPVEQKLPGWRLEHAAQEKARAARLLEIEVVQKARAALERAPDLREAHALLAGLYHERAVDAEARRDADAAAEYVALLRAHDRGRFADWLAGRGTLSLATTPPGARVEVWAIAEEDRRLVPRHPVDAGVTPIVDFPVDSGAYEVRLAPPGGPVVALSAHVGRAERWTPGPPDDPGRPVALPAALGADEVYIPAGWCQVGGDARAPDGLAARRVWIDGFILQRSPVTQADFLAFLHDLYAHGRDDEARQHAPQEMVAGTERRPLFSPGPDGRLAGLAAERDHPVVMVDHAGVRAYAAWLSARTGHAWGLPHELAWEKAARGADGRHFPWGDRFEPTWACSLHTAPGPPARASVHAFPTDESPYGVRGLAGNVRDWCGNLFLTAPPEEGAVVEPVVLDPGHVPDAAYLAVRGGSLLSLPDFARSAARYGGRPGLRYGTVGFRLARRA
ncbi:MAG: SUMF1/EgtB/PvdO family nonheme iron enzyme [Myxococcales bacterium]|nr:SUMF1/EgtB/PvdO family nonheme iron enzyme [Myxococcales bacterium]